MTGALDGAGDALYSRAMGIAYATPQTYLIGNGAKLCIPVCCQMKPHTSLGQFDGAISKELLLFLTKNISSKSLYLQLLLHFKREFPKIYIPAYYNIEICILFQRFDWTISDVSYCPL